MWLLNCESSKEKTVKPRAIREKEVRESPIQVPVKNPRPPDQVETNLGFLLNFLRLECRVRLLAQAAKPFWVHADFSES